MTRSAFLFSLLACACFAQFPGFEIINYQVVKLPPGGFAIRITDNGTITAQHAGAAYLIRNGVIFPYLLPAANPGNVYLNGMNESGDVAGWTSNLGGFTVIQGVFQTLPEVDGWKLSGHDINQQRVVVGSATKSGQFDRGFVLKDGNVTFLQCPIPGDTNAWGVNLAGDVAGTCGTFLDRRGFVYRNGTYTLITYPGAARTAVFDINANGDVVGWAGIEEAPDQFRTTAFLLRNGVFQDVSFPGVRTSTARSITDQGDVLAQAVIVHNDNFGNPLGLETFDYVRSLKKK